MRGTGGTLTLPRSQIRDRGHPRLSLVPKGERTEMDGSLITVGGLAIGVSSPCMKGQRIRYQQTGEFHFLTFSCYLRRPYLSGIAAMELFEDALERIRLRYLFVVAGYVVMPEHVHLLVNEPKRALLSKAIQALKLSVSMRSGERPFWQAHYYDFNVSSHAKFVEKLRYIHRNPVRRGLVAKPEDWRWSSYRHYQCGMRGTVEIESEWTAGNRGMRLPEWMRYRESGSSSPVPKGEGPGAPS
jgi:putative transposase